MHRNISNDEGRSRNNTYQVRQNPNSYNQNTDQPFSGNSNFAPPQMSGYGNQRLNYGNQMPGYGNQMSGFNNQISGFGQIPNQNLALDTPSKLFNIFPKCFCFINFYRSSSTRRRKLF